MSPFQTSLNTLAAGVIALLIAVGYLMMLLAPSPAPEPTTVASQPSETISLEESSPATEQLPATTSGKVIISSSKQASTSTIVSSPTPTVPSPVKPVSSPAPTKSEEAINQETRAALVNILCMAKNGLKGVSGSGIIIDSRGVILTNAHIAQYFLLSNYLTPGNVTCTIRVGSPAEARYTASLLYISPSWVETNAKQLVAVQATGTGEEDYALLVISSRTDPSASLPSSFSRVEMDRALVDTGEHMLLAAYPAGFLSTQIIQKNLYVSSAVATVTQLFSFNTTNTVDLFSVGGTVVSQGGSSGGAAVRLTDGTLAGILVTATTGASTSERDLRALSLAHIDNNLIQKGEGGFKGVLTGDIVAKAADFNTRIAPGLTAQLEAALNLKGN